MRLISGRTFHILHYCISEIRSWIKIFAIVVASAIIVPSLLWVLFFMVFAISACIGEVWHGPIYITAIANILLLLPIFLSLKTYKAREVGCKPPHEREILHIKDVSTIQQIALLGNFPGIYLAFSICYPLFSGVLSQGIMPTIYSILLYSTSIPLTVHCILRSRYRSHHLYVSRNHLFIRKHNVWKKLDLSQINSITVEKNPEINKDVYHEDELCHQMLSFATKGDQKLSMALGNFNTKQNTIIANWLRKQFDSQTVNSRVFEILGDSKKIEVCNSNAVLEPKTFAYTSAWESDMQSLLSRTNYAPMERGQSLQNGRYTISSYLSSGGFSTTYLVQTLDADTVVLKEAALPGDVSDTSCNYITEMFAKEARLLKRCSHNNIAKVLDYFQENNRQYLVLERIDGAPLSDLVRRSGAVEEAQVIEWGLKMSDFLEHMHNLNPPIIHRDFSPENLLLHSNGELYLIDFGAANEFIGQATGTLIGKQSYIAPEQLQGKAIPASDIYALGATLYFLITGKSPTPLTELHPDRECNNCSNTLNDIIAACTKLDPHQRIASATELRAKLNKARELNRLQICA
jgi:hypothetical protein